MKTFKRTKAIFQSCFGSNFEASIQNWCLPPINVDNMETFLSGGSPSSEGGWFRPAAGATVPPPPVPPTGTFSYNFYAHFPLKVLILL